MLARKVVLGPIDTGRVSLLEVRVHWQPVRALLTTSGSRSLASYALSLPLPPQGVRLLPPVRFVLPSRSLSDHDSDHFASNLGRENFRESTPNNSFCRIVRMIISKKKKLRINTHISDEWYEDENWFYARVFL